MISFRQKGAEKKLISKAESFSPSSFKNLPKYICYKAALLREKKLLGKLLFSLSFALFAVLLAWRVEVFYLQKELRKKEYILAPGIQNFTSVNPQTIPEGYIHDAVADFVSSLGNVNSQNIQRSYESLRKFMSQKLNIKFAYDTDEWISKVIDEDLAQIVSIKRKEIKSNSKGIYHATIFLRADQYLNGQYLGYEDQVVEMQLKLTPPSQNKRWYIQISELSWNKLQAFKSKSNYFKQLKGEPN